jgi:uncharacterized protein YjbI with pentapeptide repeats
MYCDFLTFCDVHVLELLRLETITFSVATFSDATFSDATFSDATFSDATFSDINNVLCHVLSQYRGQHWVGQGGEKK